MFSTFKPSFELDGVINNRYTLLQFPHLTANNSTPHQDFSFAISYYNILFSHSLTQEFILRLKEKIEKRFQDIWGRESDESRLVNNKPLS
ncbi:hypothetical protein CDL12_07539 [Handroanthus impetiginosus]|uniref:Uncharacterized protein n=1 Tax=Handroanthus impetiginosus TaxID=429701 RepID=A0A2G9HR61_9LAMI|nr:hypothetical protein CDL12_07539 [Handroanthus impetiginosus]